MISKNGRTYLKLMLRSFHLKKEKIGEALSASGQAGLFAKWRNPGQKDNEKKRMLSNLSELQNGGYPNGIPGYYKKAKIIQKIKKIIILYSITTRRSKGNFSNDIHSSII